jgi:hypothetical protein
MVIFGDKLRQNVNEIVWVYDCLAVDNFNVDLHERHT